jgi:nuclear pore complex protein Nup133
LDLKDEASSSTPSLVPKLADHLEELVDLLLESYAGAITAKVEREEEYRGLQKEYWSRRDTLLDALYQNAKTVAEAATEVGGKDMVCFLIDHILS